MWKSWTVALDWPWSGGSTLYETGPETVFQLQGDHTAQPPQEYQCQGAGEESSSISQTSNAGGKNVVFVLVVEQWIFILSTVFKGAWEFV